MRRSGPRAAWLCLGSSMLPFMSRLRRRVAMRWLHSMRPSEFPCHDSAAPGIVHHDANRQSDDAVCALSSRRAMILKQQW